MNSFLSPPRHQGTKKKNTVRFDSIRKFSHLVTRKGVSITVFQNSFKRIIL